MLAPLALLLLSCSHLLSPSHTLPHAVCLTLEAKQKRDTRVEERETNRETMGRRQGKTVEEKGKERQHSPALAWRGFQDQRLAADVVCCFCHSFVGDKWIKKNRMYREYRGTESQEGM